MARPKTIGAGEIHAAIERLAAAISRQHPAPEKLLLLGIANGGVELARRLALSLSKGSPKSSKTRTSRLKPQASSLQYAAGVLDISFHRDDIGRHPIPKEFTPAHIPADVHGATVVLVDDVLFSGRTVKAALDELFDHGRPAKVELAILVDRGGRRLPFAADYCGMTLAADENEKVVVRLDPTDPKKDTVTTRAA
ncbi:MAG TPA: bifunctional pyr operon transcriptional regulator/uracil phosphoribosyltransferase PyrR [Opitutaceae bacterium]|nr:bifunctional pyr operon transcriptional regulator/uracil phosphoribosyltransferase PyrR [Opitutaceae bacterium]